jgi:hypothetical protein
MKTTIDISDPLLERARQHAARNGLTLKALVEIGLRKILSEKNDARRFRLPKASFKGEGLHPSVRELTWDRIREKAYEGHGG